MGKQFVGTCDGYGKLIGCKNCHTYITSFQHQTSPHFNGSTGPATLFERVWNVEHGSSEQRKMTTGWHIVRDVMCIICKSKLGWMYEMAMEPDQVYKEGQVILENALVCTISQCLTDPLGDNIKRQKSVNPIPNIEQSRTRSPSESSQSSRSNSESSSSNSGSNMGLKFFENVGGNKIFICAECSVYLADKSSCQSTEFTGITGQAYLFKNVVNVSYGPMDLREMRTGNHYVRDVSCQSCDTKLGWMYELAPKNEERYKEGSVILERVYIIETDGISKEPSIMLARARRPYDVNNVRLRIAHRQEVDRLHNVENAFRFDRVRGPPVIAIFDEEQVKNDFLMNENQVIRMREDVRLLNEAIAASARGDNAVLWALGFRADIARQFRELSDMLDGEPYRPSNEADHNLVLLFERMNREQERVRFHAQANAGVMDFRQFLEERDVFAQVQAQLNAYADRHQRRLMQEEQLRMEEAEIGEGEDAAMDNVLAQIREARARMDAMPQQEEEEIEDEIDMQMNDVELRVLNELLNRQGR
ncbi:unnamed protein product [Caenorhabditis sp. 36 PRJEB53466]|nr:unnamed protein product [Caenorhabditis sp. 36 PRJEB53466]